MAGIFRRRAGRSDDREGSRHLSRGPAAAESGRVGKRKRTLYSVTTAGRAQPGRWLTEPGGAPVLEFEALLKVFFAEHGTKADLLATLAAVQDWAAQQLAEDVRTADRCLTGDGQFPERSAHLVLVGRIVSDFADMTGRWARWAAEEARQWPQDLGEATPNQEALTEIARRTPDR